MSNKKHVSFPFINEKVADGIKENANDGAVDKVVEKRVSAEIQRRADLLEKALDKYNVTKKELLKCGPDVITYGVIADGNGSEIGAAIKQEAYSEKRKKEKEVLQKLIADLDVAIMKAFTENDYSKLQQLSGGGKPKGDESATE